MSSFFQENTSFYQSESQLIKDKGEQISLKSDQQYKVGKSKKNKKKSKSKSKKSTKTTKNNFQEKVRHLKQYLLKKEQTLTKAANKCKKLDQFFQPKIQANLEPLYPNNDNNLKKINQFSNQIISIANKSVQYTHIKALEVSRSLKEDNKIKLEVKQEPLIKSKKKKEKQMSLKGIIDNYHKEEKIRLKIEQQYIKPEDIKSYSQSFPWVKSFIEQMLQSKQISNFYKQEIDELMKNQGACQYYHNYLTLIPQPISLKQLLALIQTGIVKNFIQFKILFDQMILNAKYYHTLKQNKMIIEEGELLSRKFEQKFCQLCPQKNEYIDEFKLVTNRKPKSFSVKIQQNEPQVKYMDLDDEYNRYRFSVMNRYLKKICFQNPHRLDLIIGTLQNIIKRYPNDKVQIIRLLNEQNKKEPSREKNNSLKEKLQPSTYKQEEFKEKKKLSKQISLRSQLKPGSPILSMSPKSSRSVISDDQSPKESVYYEVVPKQMEVNLFQQIKRLIIKELNDKRKKDQNKDLLDMNYPRYDSDDFEIDDDSDT